MNASRDAANALEGLLDDAVWRHPACQETLIIRSSSSLAPHFSSWTFRLLLLPLLLPLSFGMGG